MGMVQTSADMADNHTTSVTRSVRRSAFFLPSQGQALFAWMHWSDEARNTGHGVLVCPPLGYEQIHAHRTLRHLCDNLARAGLTALRFDYHGTGDSAGMDEDADRHATWLTNIHDAIRFLRHHVDCQSVSLVGMRMGAMLALQASETFVVDGLLLWAPVLKGRSYVRELKALSLTGENSPRPPGESADDMEAGGFVLTRPTMDALSKLDMLTARPRCRRALIVERGDRVERTGLRDHLSALGVETEQVCQADYADMMAEPHLNKVPEEMIARSVDWLLAGTASASSGIEASADCEPGSTQALIEDRLAIHGYISERIVSIGPSQQIFGIMSEPIEDVAARFQRADAGTLETCPHIGGAQPLVVLLNGGSVHRVGPNRLYVLLARQLAAKGFRCLRVDLRGLGDSTDADRENDPYAETTLGDVDVIIKHARAQWGARRVVLMGLCSGAYISFQSAAQLADPALVESVLINPLTYFWRDGMTIESGAALRQRNLHYYMSAALQPRKWLKLLTGKTKIGIVGACRLFLERWLPRQNGVRSEAPVVPGTAVLGHPQVEDVPGDLERATRPGRRLTCFFAASDPGYRLLLFLAKRKAKALQRSGKLRVHFIEGADHTFSARRSRHALVQAITEHLCELYPPQENGRDS